MKFIKKIVIVVIIALVAFLAWTIHGGYKMYKEALKEAQIEEKVVNIKKIDNYTEFEKLPKTYVNAIIAIEDRRFYEHKGFDVISIGRAILKDIKEKSLVEGGSTITQQLVKNIYFTQEKDFRRKIAEIFMAVELENNLNKNEILELYVNTCYFGNRYYNIHDAAKGYFEKEVENLSDYECIMLAGIPNAPSVYAPNKNPDLAKQRAEQVLNKMVEYGYLSQEEAIKIKD